MLDLLSYGFMQRAIIASITIGLLCSVIGVFVVLRGLSFVGAGTSHAAFAGVALAYLMGIHPLITAIIFSLVTIWIVYFLEEKGRMKLDVSMGIFYTLTMALAVLFIGFMRVYNAELYGYLFGSILSVTRGDLAVILILGIAVISVVFLFYKEFHFIVFDPEMAEASGIPAKLLLFLLLNLIALTIVVSLKSVGTLLVFALIIIPASAAYQMAKTMKWMMIYSIFMGILSSLGGLFISFWFDLPSGATIVLLATTLFFLALFISPKRRARVLPLVSLLFIMAVNTLGCSGQKTPDEMVYVPPGDFVIGSDEIDKEGKGVEFGSRKPWYLDEHPQRSLHLRGFYIDRFEVVNSGYKRFVDATGSRPPFGWRGSEFPKDAENYPVVNINWYEADGYCRWLGKRLPTEEEWEKAARGTDARVYPWGNEYDPKKGNTGGAGTGGAVSVGSFEGDMSPYGVYDMAGNVIEWTASWYKPYPGSDFKSDNFGEKFKVVRGDSWGDTGHYYLTYYTRASYRLNVSPEERFEFIGFRCARDL